MLNTGKIQNDIDVFNKVEHKEFPVNMRNYFKIRYDLIKVEFLIHEIKLTNQFHFQDIFCSGGDFISIVQSYPDNPYNLLSIS